jgi:hypothetical protein
MQMSGINIVTVPRLANYKLVCHVVISEVALHGVVLSWAPRPIVYPKALAKRATPPKASRCIPSCDILQLEIDALNLAGV